jgi:sulfide dehydrogenase cytochrome subunit
MMNKIREFTLLALGILTVYVLAFGVMILGFFYTPGSYAADVNKLVESCVNCHGKGGASNESDVPIIGGYSAEYLTGSLTAYKKQERPCPETKVRAGGKKGTKSDMCQTVKDLSDSDIKQVAQYFSEQKFVRAAQKFDPVLAKKGKDIHEQNCEKCHSEGGTVASDDAGMLAGQHMAYLDEAFKEFNSGKRPMAKKMKPKLEKLDKAGIEALINYYGSFK